MDLTSNEFPSLWMEVENKSGVNTICGGFYREWTPMGKNTIEAQVSAMETFTEQIERATNENKTLLIMGDANLCTERWNSPLLILARPWARRDCEEHGTGTNGNGSAANCFYRLWLNCLL